MLRLLAAALVLFPALVQAQPCSVEERSIAELSSLMERGTCTSRALVLGYLDRIEQIDRSGPTLRSMLALNPDALAQADALDAERAAGTVRGPLHGVPIVLKDNIDAERLATTAGSLVLERNVADADAPLVARLRAAGAVILGKANLSEWANFRSTASSSGWSTLGGQTRNPYVTTRTPCGSSSGTGVAVAASLAAAGVGTETDGSITCPSSMNGLVGVKPTLGLISRSGVVPLSHSQDTPGPMARSVHDAALLLSAMAGSDAADSATVAADRYTADLAAALDADALRGARIGVLRNLPFADAVDALADWAIADLRAAGAVVVDSLDLPFVGRYGGDEYEVLLYDFKHDLDAYLSSRPGAAARSLDEAVAFNRATADRSMPFFGQEIMEQALAKGALTDSAYVGARARARRLSRLALDSLLTAHNLDALIAPTNGVPWPIDPVNGDRFTGSSSQAAAVAGFPNVTVPMGLVHGLPVGLSFFGTAWSDARLLSLAYAYEQATQRREPPRYLPTVSDRP
jgi:amidase